jgi:hypothetical protein
VCSKKAKKQGKKLKNALDKAGIIRDVRVAEGVRNGSDVSMIQLNLNRPSRRLMK